MKICYVALLAGLLTACGGGGSGVVASTKSYSFVPPQAGSQRTYNQTIIDNSNNTINETIRHTTNTVNSDGSYVVLQDDPSSNSYIVNGTNYSIVTETFTQNKFGQEISYVYTPSGGSQTTCTLSPHGGGPDYPIAVGETWSLTYTLTCGSSAPISYSQTGNVVGVESVTVPAGTYSAVKLQTTTIWTGLSGTTYTNTETNWREANTGISIKRTISHSYTYSGTPPTNGHAVTTSAELSSGVL